MWVCVGLSLWVHVGDSLWKHRVFSVDVEFPMCGKGLGRELLGISVVCVYMRVLWVQTVCVCLFGFLTLCFYVSKVFYYKS